jgi:hypothetical protein
MIRIRSYTTAVILAAASAAAQDNLRVYHVSPAGSAAGDGSIERPLDLATAVGQQSPARPGDTILVHEGAFRGPFTSTLTGADGRPIVVRAAASERATIDGEFTVRGAWTWYWGLEFAYSGPDRMKDRPAGIVTFGPHTKLINLVVHDNGNGVAAWTPAENAEVYGCLIYHNGWQGPEPDRGHGHGIYTQNDAGTKRLVDNIVFNQYGYGIHAYTEQGSLRGFHIEGNILINNGIAARYQARVDNLLVGGLQPAERITVVRNLSYHTPGMGGTNKLGYRADNKDAVVQNNYFIGGNPALRVMGFEQATVTGNTYYEKRRNIFEIFPPRQAQQYSYEVDDNSYWQGEYGAPFAFGVVIFNFSDWQQRYGFDKNSRWITTPGKRPTGTVVFLRPNQYEPGRAHLGILNWDLQDAVEVDLRGVLAGGTAYEIRNAMDYYGAPVATGVFNGVPVAVPMRGLETGPEFGAFVVIPGRRTLPPRLRR